MIQLETSFSIPVGLERSWAALSDPAFVASCIPGAQITDTGVDGIHKGEIQFRFGPTVAVFRGEVQLDYDHGSHTCKIKGRGIDKKGASKAMADFVLAAATSASAGTDVTLQGGFNVIGPLEMFAKSGGVHVAKALTIEFADNMAKAINDAVAPTGPEIALATTDMPLRPVLANPSTFATLRLALRVAWEWLRSAVSRRPRAE